MRRLSIWVCAMLGLAFLGCPKKKTPSAEYERAHALFSQLYAQKLDDAYSDPKIDEIEQLLAKVSPDSVDAPAAEELKKRIATGKADRAKLAAEVQKAVQPPPGGELPPSSFEEIHAPPAAVADAGSAADEPIPGMTAAELTKRFGTCFVSSEPLMVQGQGMADAFVLRDMSVCKNKYPAYVSRVLLFRNGKLFATGNLNKIEQRLPDGGVVPEANR